MNKCNNRIWYLLIALLVGISSGCSSDDSDSPKSYSYATTSSKGDYSEWTLSGGVLNATLNVISTTGEIEYTYGITANCGAADSFGVRNCTLATSSCTDGTMACPPGDFAASFDIMDVPGVALYVNVGSGASAQLHVGFAKDSTACTQDVTGDYTMIHTGLGLNENFGVYRTDANFIDISHADFGFATADLNMNDQSVAYTTGTAAETLVEIDGGCTDGVRSRLAGGTYTIRSMMTTSGLFVADLPAGQGGLISFKVDKAAVLADFAGKSFGGISFPDNGSSEPVKADFAAVVASQIELSSTVGAAAPETLSLKALATAGTSMSPPYPDFTAVPAGYALAPLSGASEYPSPAAIPGLFKLDGLSDDGRVIIAAMKFDDKVIAVGMVYNYRTMSDPNPATPGINFASDGLYNTGNFLLFEK